MSDDCDGYSFLGLSGLTLNVTVVVTVKLFCGVEGFDHLGGGGGGIFEICSLLLLNDEIDFGVSTDLSFFTGSILLSKFRVFGLVGLRVPVGVDGSAFLNVLMRGLRLSIRSASGLEAVEGGGLYL